MPGGLCPGITQGQHRQYRHPQHHHPQRPNLLLTLSGIGGNKRSVPYTKKLCNMCHKVENLLARRKDGCTIAARYDRCAIFRSAILLAATSSSGDEP